MREKTAYSSSSSSAASSCVSALPFACSAPPEASSTSSSSRSRFTSSSSAFFFASGSVSLFSLMASVLSSIPRMLFGTISRRSWISSKNLRSSSSSHLPPRAAKAASSESSERSPPVLVPIWMEFPADEDVGSVGMGRYNSSDNL